MKREFREYHKTRRGFYLRTVISLITATYNSEKHLAESIQSAAAQNISFEHIVIDGGSEDKTVEIAYGFEHVEKIVSEPDQGLYDALNKGISLAGGNIIGFLHSDDRLPHASVLEKIEQVFLSNPFCDAVYGDLQYRSKDMTKVIRRWKSGSPEKFAQGWMPPHPALFVKREVFDRVDNFRLDIGSVADYEWMLRAIEVHGIKLCYLPETVYHMRMGGMSNRDLHARKSAFFGDLKAWEVNNLSGGFKAIFLKKLRKLLQFL